MEVADHKQLGAFQKQSFTFSQRGLGRATKINGHFENRALQSLSKVRFGCRSQVFKNLPKRCTVLW